MVGPLIGVFGSAGLAREVMPLVRAQLESRGERAECIFVDRVGGPSLNGHAVMAEDEFMQAGIERRFVIAIADGSVRRRLHHASVASGAAPLDVRARSSEVLDDVVIGLGSILCGHSSITSNTRVGAGFHLNISSYLAHDCVVGDFVTFGPNVLCAGNVVIEDDVYVGGGALIRQGQPGAPVVIGAGAVIGMGAVVTSNVAAGATVVGNPARPLRREATS